MFTQGRTRSRRFRAIDALGQELIREAVSSASGSCRLGCLGYYLIAEKLWKRRAGSSPRPPDTGGSQRRTVPVTMFAKSGVGILSDYRKSTHPKCYRPLPNSFTNCPINSTQNG